jgi:hypothetical protein
MAASSPHRSAAPHLQTPRSPRDDSAAPCGDAPLCAQQSPERSAFGRNSSRQAYLSLAASLWSSPSSARESTLSVGALTY